MTKIGWATDIHLSVCNNTTRQHFYRDIRSAGLDHLWLGGDIGEADNIESLLSELIAQVETPVAFVLGNHDFYFGSIQEVRGLADQLCARFQNTVYLSHSRVQQITPTVGLVGHDGWADGRIGNFETSMVMMHDYRHIEELSGYDKLERWEHMKQQGDLAARHLYDVLPDAMETYEETYLVTHLPPMREACWYDGNIADDEWAPHFTCKAVGDAILAIASQYSSKLTVLCGHTHSPGVCEPAPNVTIYTDGAEYEKPKLSRIIEL